MLSKHEVKVREGRTEVTGQNVKSPASFSQERSWLSQLHSFARKKEEVFPHFLFILDNLILIHNHSFWPQVHAVHKMREHIAICFAVFIHCPHILRKKKISHIAKQSVIFHLKVTLGINAGRSLLIFYINKELVHVIMLLW